MQQNSGDVKVAGHDHMVRRGAAIVNTDKDAFLEFMAARERREQEQQELASLRDEVAQMKEMLKEMRKTQ